MQPVAIIAYCALAAEFLLRYKWDKQVPRSAPVSGAIPRGRTERRLRFMLLGMTVMTVFIVIRYFLTLTLLCLLRTLTTHLGQYIG